MSKSETLTIYDILCTTTKYRYRIPKKTNYKYREEMPLYFIINY